MYKIICNSCVGAHIYNKTNNQYTTPFIWNILNFDALYYLMTDFNSINFKNFKMDIIKPRNYIKCNVDNKFDIHYIHYIESSKYDIPTKLTIPNKQRDILCKNMINTYCLPKYISRINRMLNTTDELLFIVDPYTNDTFCRKIIEDDINKIINNIKNIKVIILTTEKDMLSYSTDNIDIVLTNTGNTVINADKIISNSKFFKI